MGNEGKVVRKLTTMQSFQLVSFMRNGETGYVTKALNDPEYAEFVNQQGWDFSVTVGNIQGARTAMGLPATKNAGQVAAKTAAEEVLSRLASVEDKLDRLLKYFSEQARRDL
jgi:hypothetical protein